MLQKVLKKESLQIENLQTLSRGGRIRTYDLHIPNVARYQATLHPDCYFRKFFAEREGFEPSAPVSQCGSLANYWFQPLTHLSLEFLRSANVWS